MGQYIARRLISLIPVLIGVSLIVFLLPYRVSIPHSLFEEPETI